MADNVIFLVQMELALSAWIRFFKHNKECQWGDRIEGSKSAVNSGSSHNNENQDPEAAQNSAVSLQTPEEASHVLADGGAESQFGNTHFAKALYRLVRARDRVFGCGLFSDPVWDIVLLLYAGKAEGARVKFDELCDALPASPATLERCLLLLESRGLVLRDAKSPTTELALTAKTLEMMDEIFALSTSQPERIPGGNEV